MKKYLSKSFNTIIRKTGLKSSEFGMDSIIERLSHRNLNINTIIDIGASNGTWSTNTMKFFPNASFLAVEPLDERRESLKSVRERYSNFNYAICAAGAGDGDEVTLNVTSDLDGSTIDGRNSGEARTISLRTIDSLVAEKSLRGPFFLKFDTHGYEVPILEGCKNILKETQVILMETYNFKLTPASLRFYEMCSYLEKIGFRPADIADPLLRAYDQTFWQIDIIFIRIDSPIFKYPHYK